MEITKTSQVTYYVSNNKYMQNAWLYHIDDVSCIVIDPNEEVFNHIVNNHLKPEAVFLTHGHFDHITGLNLLYSKFNCDVYATAASIEMLKDSSQNFSVYYLKEPIELNIPVIVVEDKKFIEIFSSSVECVYMPGHSQGDMVIKISNYLFVGDLLLYNKKTPVGLPGSSKMDLKNTLAQINENYDDDLIICPGHGKSFQKKEWNIEKSLS